VFLIDTNLIVDIVNDNPTWVEWSESVLSDAAHVGPVYINPIVYAEVSLAYDTIEALNSALGVLGITREPLPFEAGFLAGRAYLAYRRAGGTRSSPMPDFYIGAHAVVAGLTVLTRDPRRIRNYFPTVKIIAPSPV
jgi:predicted nucleic acid-binding protein